jgi:hypothetical protein
MALAAGTSLSSLPHSSMGRLEVIMVERFSKLQDEVGGQLLADNVAAEVAIDPNL